MNFPLWPYGTLWFARTMREIESCSWINNANEQYGHLKGVGILSALPNFPHNKKGKVVGSSKML